MKTIFGIIICFFALTCQASDQALPSQNPQKENLLQQDHLKNDNLVPTDIPHFFYSDTRAWSLYLGGLYYLSQTDSLPYGIFGISYLWFSQTRFHIESAFDVFANQQSHLRVMAKWFSNQSSDVRPYAAIGVGLKILPSDNLGVLLAWSRLMAHGSVGADISWNQHWSIKFEVYAGVDQSLNSFYGILTGPVLSY